MKLDKNFSTKLIITGLLENEVIPFVKCLIEQAWLEHDIPSSMKVVGSGKKLTMDMLPKSISIEDIANNAMKHGLFKINKFGPVDINLNGVISKVVGTNPSYRVDLDKYYYENSNNNLEAVINTVFKIFNSES